MNDIEQSLIAELNDQRRKLGLPSLYEDFPSFSFLKTLTSTELLPEQVMNDRKNLYITREQDFTIFHMNSFGYFSTMHSNSSSITNDKSKAIQLFRHQFDTHKQKLAAREFTHIAMSLYEINGVHIIIGILVKREIYVQEVRIQQQKAIVMFRTLNPETAVSILLYNSYNNKDNIKIGPSEIHKYLERDRFVELAWPLRHSRAADINQIDFEEGKKDRRDSFGVPIDPEVKSHKIVILEEPEVKEVESFKQHNLENTYNEFRRGFCEEVCGCNCSQY